MNEREIFIEALQRPNEEKRTAFLNEACGHDAELLERVNALLNDEPESFLERPAFKIDETSDSGGVRQDVGTTVGPYKLMEQIGEGGFGLVFVAEQREPVRRLVALKLIKPGMDSVEVIARFEAERQALALMDHPNIARVLDAGTTDTGLPYFVMDLVRGIPITTFCDENQLSPRKRLKLFLPICRAVQHAHQKGIIHRDLKPSNILVTLHDGHPVPKVIDFGVAKALNQQLTQRTIYTRFSQMIGTPLYMSPEQAEMSGLDVDTRSDIYSLGVLLYELLTGSTPFDRKQLSEAAFDEVRRIIREEEPPKPSTRLSQSGERLRGLAAQRKTEPAKLSRMIRGDLDWIVMKALEKDRQRRYETANGFASDIERYLCDEAVVARPQSTSYRLKKFAIRNKAAFTTIMLVMTSLLLGTIVSTSLWVRESKALRTSEEQSDLARTSEQIAKTQSARAQASEAELRERFYASEMTLASERLAVGDISFAKELINNQIPESSKLDQRGLEWDLLWRTTHPYEVTTASDNPWFESLAVSPDGKMIATIARASNTVQVYDSARLMPICSPLPVGTDRDRLCFSPDGRHLIVASAAGGNIRFFDTNSWGHKFSLKGRAVACAREKPIMATSGGKSGKEIILWDTNSWQRLDTLATEGGVTRHLAISRDGTKLVSVFATDYRLHSPDRIGIWDLTTKPKLVRTLSSGIQRDDQVVFSPDGELLSMGDASGVVRIWNVDHLFAEGEEPAPKEFQASNDPISSMSFSADSTRLAVATVALTTAPNPVAAQVWDISASPAQPVATRRGSPATDVSFVGNSDHICVTAMDSTIKIWDPSESLPYDVVQGVNYAGAGVGYGKDGSLIYLDYKEGAIHSWDGDTRKSEKILDPNQSYSRIALSGNGDLLAGITKDEKRLRVWNLTDGTERSFLLDLDDFRNLIESRGGVWGDRGSESKRSEATDRLVSSLRISNDARFVACVTPLTLSHPYVPALVVLLDARNGRIIDAAPFRTTADTPVSISPSGRQLVALDYRGRSAVLSDITASGLQIRRSIAGPTKPLRAAFSADERTVAISNFFNEIRLHDANDGTLDQTLKGHAAWTFSMAFSSDSRTLVSAGSNGGIRIWKRSSDEFDLVGTLQSNPQLNILSVAISPNSDSLAVLRGFTHSYKRSHEGTIQVWRGATQQEVRQNVDQQLLQASISKPFDAASALTELDGVLRRVPDNPRARVLRARVHDQLGDWESAVDDWTSLINVAPDNHYFLESRARAYALGRKWEKAIADWNTLMQLTGGANGRYLLGRGECYLHMGSRLDAHRDLTKALACTAGEDTVQRIVSLLGMDEGLVPIRSRWRYVTGNEPPEDWKTRDFDDNGWRIGWAPFGTAQRYLQPRTEMGAQGIWLRHTFKLDREIAAPLALRLRSDDDVDVYINGILAVPAGSAVNYQREPWSNALSSQYFQMYPVVQCSPHVRLRIGTNVIAVHCRNRRVAKSYFDVGLYMRNDEIDIESALQGLTTRAPNNDKLHMALAIRFLEQRCWKDAASHFHEAAKVRHDTDLPWIWAALLYAHGEETERYRQLTLEIVNEFKTAGSANQLGVLATACLLKEPSPADLQAFTKMAARSLDLDPQSPASHVAMALAEYHRGEFESAAAWARKCGDDNRLASGVLALIHAKAGDVELAGKEMAKMKQGLAETPFRFSFTKKDETLEAAMLKILHAETQRKLAD